MVVLENVVKAYRTGSGQVKALDGVNLRIEEGQFVVISGPSGSGKTTLLMTMAGMLRPSGGKVSVGGSELYKMSIPDRASFRAGNIGFVFQMFHLVPYLNVIENVVLAGPSSDKTKANELLNQLGLSQRTYHKPSQLSAGEKQRTAVARPRPRQRKSRARVSGPIPSQRRNGDYCHSRQRGCPLCRQNGQFAKWPYRKSRLNLTAIIQSDISY